jgi:hypothetical protein
VCVEKIVHNFIRANGYANDEIPAVYCGRDDPIYVPTQRVLRVLRASLFKEDCDLKAKLLKLAAESTKSVSGESDEEKTLPVATSSCSPRCAYKSPNRLEFVEALE